MKIIEALRDKTNMLRISYGDRWLCGNTPEDGWIVYERKPYARQTIIIIETNSEDEAVKNLLEASGRSF